jgi:hypothetical protein
MSMLVAVPRSLAAFPWLLMARDLPALSQRRASSTNMTLALKELTDGTVDLLCTGYTELLRFPEADRPARICTYVWGLSAIVARDGALESSADLARYCGQNAGAALVLPFAGSPARSAGSGAGFALIGIGGHHSARTPRWPKRCNAGQRVSSVRRFSRTDRGASHLDGRGASIRRHCLALGTDQSRRAALATGFTFRESGQHSGRRVHG